MKDDKVKKYLEELESAEIKKFDILQLIRSEVKNNSPDIEERMMYGGIMFSAGNKDLGGVFVRKNHISVEFITGHIMNDPYKRLEGIGKSRRHIKIKDKSEIAEKDLAFFIRQMILYKDI